jgi:hypothetical protein
VCSSIAARASSREEYVGDVIAAKVSIALPAGRIMKAPAEISVTRPMSRPSKSVSPQLLSGIWVTVTSKFRSCAQAKRRVPIYSPESRLEQGASGLLINCPVHSRAVCFLSILRPAAVPVLSSSSLEPMSSCPRAGSESTKPNQIRWLRPRRRSKYSGQ